MRPLYPLALIALLVPACGGAPQTAPSSAFIAPPPSDSAAGSAALPASTEVTPAQPPSAVAGVASTRQSAMALHTVAEAWRANNANECPTAQLLKDKREIAASSRITDAWDQPYKIICDDDDTLVVSFGPDKKEGTADDIRVPTPAPR